MSEADRPLRLLSLDGGGIRGLSSILILKEVMRRMNSGRPPEKHLHPWQVFDLIGGTSTGGIIAIMLGRLRMTLDECERAYIELSETIFKPKRWKYNAMQLLDRLALRERYDSKAFEKVIKRVICGKTGNQREKLKSPAEPCKTFVCTVSAHNSNPTLLRSYDNPAESDLESDGFELWEACRATSAANGYFDALVNRDLEYVDGAFGYNNPVFEVMNEARSLWKDREALMISIGTGIGPRRALNGNAFKVIQSISKLVTGSEPTADSFFRTYPSMVEHGMYFRFSVDGLGAIPLGDFKEIPRIKAETIAYLRPGPSCRALGDCAERLLGRPLKVDPPVPKDMAAFTENESRFLKALHNTSGDYATHRVTMQGQAPQTCEWFLGEFAFRKWLSAESSSLLWFTANAGCGKTVLASYVVDFLSREFQDCSVCYFFFRQGDDHRSEAHQAVAGLLHQSLVQNPGALKRLEADLLVADASSHVQPMERNWDNLETVSSQSGQRQIFCIIDALDECSVSSRNRLVKILKKTFVAQDAVGKRNNRLKLIITSKPLPDIEEQLTIKDAKRALDIENGDKTSITSAIEKPSRAIRIRGEDKGDAIAADIETMVRYRVDELRENSSLPPEACELLKSTIIQRADGSFLWASLVFDAVARLHSRSLRSIREVLVEVPSTLKDLYGHTMRSFEEPLKSARLLQILLAASRPMNLDELNGALSIRDDSKTLEDLQDELEPDIEYTVKKLGGFLVRITNGMAFLVHTTARQFLLDYATNATSEVLWKRSLGSWECNKVLATSCLRVLLLDGLFLPGGSNLQTSSTSSKTAWCVASSFYEYAGLNWLRHGEAQEPPLGEDPDIRRLSHVFCDPQSENFQRWWQSHERARNRWRVLGTPFPMESCVSPYYAHFGAVDGNWLLIRGLADNGFDIWARNAVDMDILVAAAMMGQGQVVRWLLKHFDHSLMRIDTALMGSLLSIKSGSDTAKVLVETGLDLGKEYVVPSPNPGAAELMLPVFAAISGGPWKLEMILNSGATFPVDAIAPAAKSGYFTPHLEILFRYDRRPLSDRLSNLHDALEFATRNGLLSARKLIMQQCPDIACEVDISEGLRPIVSRGGLDDLRELLSLGAQDATGAALTLAAEYHRFEEVEMLLSSPAYTYPAVQLSDALRGYFRGDEDQEKYILRTIGRNFMKDKALYKIFDFVFCEMNGSEEIRRYLSLMLEKGATLTSDEFSSFLIRALPLREGLAPVMLQEIPSFEGNREKFLAAAEYFTLACLWGQEDTVAVIHALGVDINGVDHFGITPMLAGAISGKLAVVKFLLDHGAVVSAQACQYRGGNLPSRGTAEGERPAKQLPAPVPAWPFELMRRQWDAVWQALGPEEDGRFGGTPLSIARRKGYRDIEAALTQHG